MTNTMNIPTQTQNASCPSCGRCNACGRGGTWFGGTGMNPWFQPYWSIQQPSPCVTFTTTTTSTDTTAK